MRRYENDGRLWLLASSTIFLPFGIGLLVEGLHVRNFRQVEDLISYAFVLMGASIVAGWIIQAIAVVCGVRLKSPPPPEEATEAAKREFKEETGFTLTGPFIALTPIKQKGGKIVHARAL